MLKFYNKNNVDRYLDVENLHHFKDAKNKGKGVIFSTAHFGSWELAAHIFALKGFKSLILYKPLKKPQWLEVWVKKRRQINGNVLISKYNAMLTVFRALKKGKMVGFIADQHCTPEDGLLVPFFGHKVWTHTSFIKLSLKTGAPIVPGFMITKNFFKYEMKVFKPLYPQDFLQYENPEYEMAVASNKILEQIIRKKPENWMWMHRRFKNLY